MSKNRGATRIATDAPAIELIEEGVHLLKEAGPAALFLPLLGGGPFALLFIYFWFVMSRSPVAGQQLAVMAGELTVLYFWMRYCQARHSLVLWELATGLPHERQRVGERIGAIARIMFWQGLYVPVQLVSLLATVTLPWTTAFFQTQLVMALHGGEAGSFDQLRKASREAPGQMGGILAYLCIAWFVLSVNLLILLMFLPSFLQGTFGVQSEFARLGDRLLNGDTTIIAFVVAWLLLSPLITAVAVLRTFQNKSQKSGEDILVMLRRFRGTTALLAIVGLCLATAAHQTTASENQASASQIDEVELQHAIEKAFERPELSWREGDSDLYKLNATADFFNHVNEWLKKLFGKFLPKGGKRTSNEVGGQFNLAPLGWTLLVILALVCVFLLARALLSGRGSAPQAQTTPPRPPDVRDETVHADALPPNEWEDLALRLLEQGHCRAALRAFFLAQIATLSSAGLIRFTRYKTNRDYYRELKRYAASNKELTRLFDASTILFEGIWYGGQEASQSHAENIGEMTSQLRRIAS